jgi:AAA family ATP:ADP antiporter
MQLGPEVISAVRLYGVLPSIFLFTFLYSKLTNHFSRTQIYFLINTVFIAFFMIFGVFLYPKIASSTISNSVLIETPTIFKYHIIMLYYWPYTVFYILAELWPSVMLALMFWQIANQIYSVDEAKTYYPLLALSGEIGAAVGGIVITLITSSYTDYNWEDSIRYFSILIFVSGLLISLFSYLLINRLIGAIVVNGNIRITSQVSVFDNIKYLLLSKHIRFIAIILLCYGITISVFESAWEKQLSLLFTNSSDYCHFIGKVQMALSLTAICFDLISSRILKRVSMIVAMLITPILIIVTGIPFFLSVISQSMELSYSSYFGLSLLQISIFIGTIQNILVKAAKYSFLDPVKETVFIPLGEELKTKGKAVTDVIGERLGNSGGSFIQWLMLSLIPAANITIITPYLFIVFSLVIIWWLYALVQLNKLQKNHD